jgi:hypothetical protein
MIRGFGVHDAAVSAFTMARFRRSRCCEFRTWVSVSSKLLTIDAA